MRQFMPVQSSDSDLSADAVVGAGVCAGSALFSAAAYILLICRGGRCGLRA